MKKPATFQLQALNIGAAGRNRTHDPLVRSPPKPNIPLQKQRLTALTPCSSAQSCRGLREPLTQKSRTHYGPMRQALAVRSCGPVCSPPESYTVSMRVQAHDAREVAPPKCRGGVGKGLIFITALVNRLESRANA